jgi:hypothetical protein
MLQYDFSPSLQSELESVSNCCVVCGFCWPDTVLYVLDCVLLINLSKNCRRCMKLNVFWV